MQHNAVYKYKKLLYVFYPINLSCAEGIPSEHVTGFGLRDSGSEKQKKFANQTCLPAVDCRL